MRKSSQEGRGTVLNFKTFLIWLKRARIAYFGISPPWLFYPQKHLVGALSLFRIGSLRFAVFFIILYDMLCIFTFLDIYRIGSMEELLLIGYFSFMRNSLSVLRKASHMLNFYLPAAYNLFLTTVSIQLSLYCTSFRISPCIPARKALSMHMH